jgi:hypothetical protein
MALSKALVQTFRKNTLLVGAGWRAFFSPFNLGQSAAANNTSIGPKILDLQNGGPFNTNAPPSGWFDLGWIKDFKITPQSKIGQVRSGYRGAVRAQYRGQVGEQFEFAFREATRLAFKIAVGTTPFNLTKTPAPSTAGPLSGSGAQAVPLGASGYQAAGAGATAGSPTVFVPAGSGALFTAGAYIVVDQDYTNQTGIVNDAGQPVSAGQVTDIDFIRKTSDYVARVTSIAAGAVAGQDGLVLNNVFVGGGSSQPGVAANTGPTAGAKVQQVVGWAVREGATFITEWSALFIMDTIDAAQIAIYYPHVSISQFKDVAAWAIENIGTTDETGYQLDCAMEALAFDDPEDGETVVGYKAFYPRPSQDIQI